MAISVTAGPVVANTGSGTSLGVTLTGTTAGRSVIIGVCWESGSTTLDSVACTGESVNLAGTAASGGGMRTQLAYVSSLASGGSRTFTANFSATIPGAGIFAMEVDGADTADFLDTSVADSQTSANPSTNITTGATNCLIVGCQVNTTGSPTPGSGYTAVSGTASWNKAFKAEYKIAASAGVHAVDWVNATSQTWVIAAASFNELSASPNLSPAAGTLTLTGYAPTVGGNRSAAPAVGTLGMTGYAPTVSTSMSPVLAPTAGALSMVGYAPTVTNENTGSAAINLLAHALDAEGEAGASGSADMALLLHTSSASGSSGVIGSAALTLLLHELAGGGNPGLVADLLLPTLEATGIAGGVASAEVALLVHDLSASGTQDNAGTASITLLGYELTGASTASVLGVLEASRALHTLDGVGFAGVVGTAEIALLPHTLTTIAFQPGTGSAEVDLVTHLLEASGFASVAENYRGWVLNTRTAGLTEYSNFRFNSFAQLDGAYLAAGPTGIHVLAAQDLDNEDVINARVRTGSADYGSSWLKRVPRVYVTGEFPGEMYFRTITEQDGERTYILPANGITGDQQRRVPVGQGPKSVKWQFELENVAGSEFRLSKVMAYLKELRRRVQ